MAAVSKSLNVFLALLVVAASFVAVACKGGSDGGADEPDMPEKAMFTKLEGKGTNGVSVKFRFIADMDATTGEGKLKIAFRPWTGTSTGDVIATIEHDVTKADFAEDSMGNPDFKKDFTLEPKFPMPAGTAWLHAEFSFEPKGGKAFTWEDKFIHQNIKKE